MFFAGQNHVHIQVVASPTEAGLITTNPEQVAQMAAAEQQQTVDLQQGAAYQPQGTIDLTNQLSPGSMNNL